MEAQKPKIALYVQRSFGEKLTATFDFIKENWKPLMKFTTYLMLPLCLLQGLSLNGLMSGTMALGDMTGGSFDSSVVGASIMALVTYYSLVCRSLSARNCHADLFGLRIGPYLQ